MNKLGFLEIFEKERKNGSGVNGAVTHSDA